MTEESNSAREVWESVGRLDYGLFAMAAMHQAFVAVTMAHLLWCRAWPPYVVKNVPLVCVTGIAGLIELMGIVITSGFLRYEAPTLLSNCFFQGLVNWTGAGLFYCAAVVRVYRNYMVLIRHSVDMRRPAVQILMLQGPIWAATVSLLFPSVVDMDFSLNRCMGNARYVILGIYNYSGVMLLVATSLMWKMRNVRKQMNEYWVMLVSLGYLMLMVVVFNITTEGLAVDSMLARRVALANNAIQSALLFWPIILTPLWKYVRRDVAYAEMFTLGLAPAVAPGVLRGSLADQLKVDELWAHFRKIAEERMSPSFPAFFKACMDRDREEGYFERQARTMDIIGTYVTEDAPSKVDLSEDCRVRILASEVSRYNIFEEATAEVLRRMQETCEEAFQRSGALGQLLGKVEKDEADVETLQKAKLMPKSSSASVGRGLASGSDGSRSDRWTNSTATRSDATRTSFLGSWRLRLRGLVRRRENKSNKSRQNRVVKLSTAGAMGEMASCSVSYQTPRGNRSDDASQHTLGLTSPAEAAAWGPASPLPWVAEEVKGMEVTDASSQDGGNTRTPSTLSVRRDSSLFASRTPNMPDVSMPVVPLPPAPASAGSLMSTPSPHHERPPLPAPPPPKRASPAPWVPWRRSPENFVAPSELSPSVITEASLEEGVVVGQRSMPPQDIFRIPISENPRILPDEGDMSSGEDSPKAEMSSEDSSLVILVLPPSPASWPPSPVPMSSATITPQRWRQNQPRENRQRVCGSRGERELFSRTPRDEEDLETGTVDAASDGGEDSPSLQSRRASVDGFGRETREHSCNQKAECEPSSNGLSTSKEIAVASVPWKEREGAQGGGGDPGASCVLHDEQWPTLSPQLSLSDCSEKRTSGATCWSSGVGGGGAILEALAMTGADPPMPSPHLSSTSTPPPGMLSISPFRPPFAESATVTACPGHMESGLTALESSPFSTISPPGSESPARRASSLMQSQTFCSPLPFVGSSLSTPTSLTPQDVPITRSGRLGGESGPGGVDIDVEMGSSGDGEVHKGEQAPSIPPSRSQQGSDSPPACLENLSRRASVPKELGKKELATVVGESTRKVPKNRPAAPSQANASTLTWAIQPAKPTHPPKATQPARALPARAPAWEEAPPIPSPLLPVNVPSLTSCSELASSSRFTLPHELRSRQQPDLSPPGAYPLMPLMLELVAVPTYAFAPPSPAGRSTSASPSSVRSSPLMAPRAVQMQGALPPPPPARDPVPSGPGVPSLWSWSDSTLSGSISGGRGGGASSEYASASPDPSSPLVGIKFLGAAEPELAFGEITGRELFGDGGRKVDGMAVSSEAAGAGAAIGDGTKSSNIVQTRAGVATEDEPVRRADLSRNGGVGGREGRRPRRYFFP